MTSIYELLEQLDISYQRFDHKPVFTCEEADQLGLDIPGAKDKNLFLRDRKGKRHFLLVVSDNKSVDIKKLSQSFNSTGLSFGSADRLKKHLDLEPGAVSILGIVNDPENSVELFVDRDIWDSEALQCHPLVNTSTLAISIKDIKVLLSHLNKTARIIDVPTRDV